MSDIEEQIKKAELARIQAEAKKLDAERLKNAEELKILKKSFFKSDRFFQALITAVVGLPVLYAFFNFFIGPANEAKVSEQKALVTEQMASASEQRLKNSVKDSINNEKDKQLSFQGRMLKQREDELGKQKKSNRHLLDSIQLAHTELIGAKKLLLKGRQALIAEKNRTVAILDDQVSKLQADPGNRKILLQVLYFDYESTVIKKASEQRLKGVVEFLKAYPNISISIEGHSYSESGTLAYTLRLSRDRANVVRTYLANNGIAAQRVLVKGYGETPTGDRILNGIDKNIEKRLYELKSSVDLIVKY